MTHLSPSDLVEYVEGTLATARVRHVDACGTCRAAAADLSEIMRRAADVDADVPEPSPLFWDHLSARVREAVARERVGGTAWWLASLRPFAPVAAAAVLLVLVSATMVVRRQPPPAGVEAARSVAVTEPGMDVDATIDPASNEVWEVLTAAAADLELEDAHAAGLSVQPAAFDRAVQRLNADELNELGRLLQSELKRSGN
jgi:hypothetical protein